MGISLQGQYDAEATTNEAIPEGVYIGRVIEAQQQPVSKDNPAKGDALVLTWELQDKRLLWQRILLWFEGPDADKAATTRRIASASLADVAEAAVGRREINDTDELLHRDCQISVGIREYNGRHFNEVKKVKGVGASVPPAAVASAASSTPTSSKPAGNRFAAARAARNDAPAQDAESVPF